MSDAQRTDEQKQHPQVGDLPEPATGDDAAVRGGALNTYFTTVRGEKQGKGGSTPSITDGTSNTISFGE